MQRKRTYSSAVEAAFDTPLGDCASRPLPVPWADVDVDEWSDAFDRCRASIIIAAGLAHSASQQPTSSLHALCKLTAQTQVFVSSSHRAVVEVDRVKITQPSAAITARLNSRTEVLKWSGCASAYVTLATLHTAAALGNVCEPPLAQTTIGSLAASPAVASLWQELLDSKLTASQWMASAEAQALYGTYLSLKAPEKPIATAEAPVKSGYQRRPVESSLASGSALVPGPWFAGVEKIFAWSIGSHSVPPTAAPFARLLPFVTSGPAAFGLDQFGPIRSIPIPCTMQLITSTPYHSTASPANSAQLTSGPVSPPKTTESTFDAVAVVKLGVTSKLSPKQIQECVDANWDAVDMASLMSVISTAGDVSSPLQRLLDLNKELFWVLLDAALRTHRPFLQPAWTALCSAPLGEPVFAVAQRLFQERGKFTVRKTPFADDPLVEDAPSPKETSAGVDDDDDDGVGIENWISTPNANAKVRVGGVGEYPAVLTGEAFGAWMVSVVHRLRSGPAERLPRLVKLFALCTSPVLRRRELRVPLSDASLVSAFCLEYTALKDAQTLYGVLRNSLGTA